MSCVDQVHFSARCKCFRILGNWQSKIPQTLGWVYPSEARFFYCWCDPSEGGCGLVGIARCSAPEQVEVEIVDSKTALAAIRREGWPPE